MKTRTEGRAVDRSILGGLSIKQMPNTNYQTQMYNKLTTVPNK